MMRRLLLILALLALATPVAAQTARVTTQTRTDTVVAAAGRVTYPATFTRSRVQWRLCLQIDLTTAPWKCSQQTGSWFPRVVPAPDTTPVLAGLALSPKAWEMPAGDGQFFALTPTWADGQTRPLTPTWTATGGTVAPLTGGGFYTAGAIAGTFRVIASTQGKADTATVTVTTGQAPPPPPPADTQPTPVPPPPTGPLAGTPNAPGYANKAQIDFSQPVPAPLPDIPGYPSAVLPRYLIAGQPWLTVYDVGSGGDNGSRWARVIDASAPQSPGSTWENRIPAGSYGSASGGEGFGNINYAFPQGASRVYFADWVQYASNYSYNQVSTKYLSFFKGPTNGLLVEWLDGGMGGPWWVQIVDNYCNPQCRYTSTGNRQPAGGQWHRVEVRVELGSPGLVRLWIDGQLLASSTQAVNTAPILEIAWTNHLGGGGGTVATPTWLRHDHLYLEWE